MISDADNGKRVNIQATVRSSEVTFHVNNWTPKFVIDTADGRGVKLLVDTGAVQSFLREQYKQVPGFKSRTSPVTYRTATGVGLEVFWLP